MLTRQSPSPIFSICWQMTHSPYQSSSKMYFSVCVLLSSDTCSECISWILVFYCKMFLFWNIHNLNWRALDLALIPTCWFSISFLCGCPHGNFYCAAWRTARRGAAWTKVLIVMHGECGNVTNDWFFKYSGRKMLSRSVLIPDMTPCLCGANNPRILDDKS